MNHALALLPYDQHVIEVQETHAGVRPCREKEFSLESGISGLK